MNNQPTFPSNPLLTQILTNETTKITNLLNNITSTSTIIFLGETTLSNTAPSPFILKITNDPFNPSSLSSIQSLLKTCSSPKQFFLNDIYNRYITSNLNQTQNTVELIYPASTKEIDKFKQMNFELIIETKELYETKTLPYIMSIPPQHTKWIDNILYNNAEPLIEQNEKYVLLQNYSAQDKENLLDCIALPYNAKDIKSVRDLNETHLILLEDLYNQARCILAKKFKCKDNEIRVFVHYPPSFYYFHVHYVHVDNNVDMSISVNRAIPLGDIIQNIKMKSNYYQLISIEHTVKVGSDLYKALKQ